MQRIVLAANAEADQPWVADAAAQLAQENSAHVSVISVDEVEVQRLSVLPRHEAQQRAERAANRIADRLEAAGIKASRTVLAGNALEQILAFADQEDADLIVVGSSVRGPVASALLGSVPMGLVRRSKRPVLVVTGPSS